nr:phage related protein [Bartonella melophagi]
MVNNVSQTILCLDLGTKTGWAISSEDEVIASGTVHFPTRRFEGGGMRYLRFKQWLTQTKAILGHIDAVYFEEVRCHIGTDAAHVYGGLLATLTTWCECYQIPYDGIPIATIKKAMTGRGNASKTEMIKAVRAKGHEPEDDNEADALAILYLKKEGGM